MPKLTIQPFAESIELRRGETIRDALYRAGIEIDSPCNGQGICGKCQVRLDDPRAAEPTPHPEISEEQQAEGLRLSCQVKPRRDLCVHLLSDYSRDEYRILEGHRYPDDREEMQTLASASEAGNEGGSKVLRRPAAEVVESEGVFWLRYENEPQRLLEKWSSRRPAKGLAIDIGTTSLVVTLISLDTCEELATASSLNPQIRFGHDVVRRIEAGSTAEGLKELSSCVRDALNDLIEEVCIDSRTAPQEVLDVVVGGNTTMLQLAAAIDPGPLGRVPFTVGIQSGRTCGAGEFGLDVHPEARLYIPPVAHAYIGADISAGLLVCHGFFAKDKSVLFVDIGTNGEMGLSAGGKSLLTSTAAGPAFEGMGISSGGRAQIGALERVIWRDDGITFKTIGNAPVKAICGSGIIDLTAALLQTGVIDPSGRMQRPGETEELPPELSRRLAEINEKPAFHIGGEVYFTQDDVRQVQLAKSAIRAAIDILMKEAEIDAGGLERVVIAGGFGYSLKPANLGAIGLIPEDLVPKVYFAGNTCRIGCVRLLRNVANRRFLEKRMRDVSHVPIESRPDFMDLYVTHMEF
jgi:uncharacterized 2Fe-2S/4Fe-4S cluster protein (DUF4445 family)